MMQYGPMYTQIAFPPAAFVLAIPLCAGKPLLYYTPLQKKRNTLFCGIPYLKIRYRRPPLPLKNDSSLNHVLRFFWRGVYISLKKDICWMTSLIVSHLVHGFISDKFDGPGHRSKVTKVKWERSKFSQYNQMANRVASISKSSPSRCMTMHLWPCTIIAHFILTYFR